MKQGIKCVFFIEKLGEFMPKMMKIGKSFCYVFPYGQKNYQWHFSAFVLPFASLKKFHFVAQNVDERWFFWKKFSLP